MKYRVWRLISEGNSEDGFTVSDRRELPGIDIDLQEEDEELIRQICGHTGVVNGDDLCLDWEYAESVYPESIWLVTMKGEHFVELGH